MKSASRPFAMPRLPAWFSVATRLLFSLFTLLLSAYCLLAYLPDTYYSYIRAPFQSWLTWLIRLQPAIFTLFASLLCLVLFLEQGKRQLRRAILEFAALQIIAVIFFFAIRPFSHLGNDSRSFLWSVVLLIPVVLLGVLDRAAHWNSIRESNSKPPQRLEFAVPLLLAATIGIVYPFMGIIRARQAGPGFAVGGLDIWAWAGAITAHLLFCAFLVGLFNLPESLFRNSSFRPELRFLLGNFLAWLVLDRLVQNVILDTLPFHSLESQIYSVVFSLALLMIGGSLVLPIRQKEHRASTGRATNPLLPVALGFVLLIAIYVVPAFIGMLDWNFLLEKMWTLGLWTSVFFTALLWRKMRAPRPYPIAAMVVIVVCSPLLYVFALGHPAEELLPAATSRRINTALDRHLSFDTSFRVIQEMWSWREEKSCDELCQYLLTQTNLPPSAQATATDIALVKNLAPTPVKKPNIFIFVIDSLRQDYVSAYNPAVHFTPEIGKFAAESTVLRNSFTRYAGTTLSEPAIWTGSMLLHKHYVQPFHNMNSLEKLLNVDGYERFISVDTVLQVLLQHREDIVPLDENVQNWTQEDYCSTVKEAETRISRRTDPSRPIFMFAQPQNIHAVTIAKLGSARDPKKPYPGFHAKTASELERLDGCFGGFVRYLKSAGLYNDSIIVLTSDHGDSYGEFGRWSHSLEVNPDVLRIPLIIHLPDSMKNTYYNDPDRIAFNIDITPTIYYLLGHQPIVNDPRFGRPLFTRTEEEADAYQRTNYLVVSSYGPVYGLLGDNGKSLFVANAVQGTNAYFDLKSDPEGTINRVNDKLLPAYQKIIRDDVGQIADLYRYRYHAPSFRDWLMH